MKEGVLRQAEFVNNEFIDLFLYSMLKEEWIKNKEKQ
jgi:ribosomal-protein-serine acetyltransferase